MGMKSRGCGFKSSVGQQLKWLTNFCHVESNVRTGLTTYRGFKKIFCSWEKSLQTWTYTLSLQQSSLSSCLYVCLPCSSTRWVTGMKPGDHGFKSWLGQKLKSLTLESKASIHYLYFTLLFLQVLFSLCSFGLSLMCNMYNALVVQLFSRSALD